MKVQFLETCGACPESYDAYINNEYIGNLRLRHGYFRVNFNYNNADYTIFEANPKESGGVFTSDERHYYLNQAAMHLSNEYERELNGQDENYEFISDIP